MAAQTPSPKTEYAKRYRVSTRIPWAKAAGKSGLTPIRYDDLEPNSEAFFLERWQRSILCFTTRELLAAGCLDESDAQASILTSGPIHDVHPLFVKTQWERDTEPLGLALEGTWHVDNPVVWRALEPSLLLASRIIRKAHMWLWFDGLVYGPKTLIPPEDYAQDGGPSTPLYSFTTRSGPEAEKDRDKLQERKFKDLARFIKLALVDFPKPGTKGLHVPNYDRQYYTGTVYLARSMLLCLLRPEKMTASEILVQRYLIAKTLVHEITHALGYFVKGDSTDTVFEHFFEDEEISECGKSCENVIYGGAIATYLEDLGWTGQREYPMMTAYVTTWPSYADFDQGKKEPGIASRFRNHANFDVTASPTRDIWPIQISWLQWIQTDATWDTLQSRGPTALFPPRIIGMHFEKIQNSPLMDVQEPPGFLFGNDYLAWARDRQNLPLWLPLTEQDIEERELAGPFLRRSVAVTSAAATPPGNTEVPQTPAV